MLRAREIRVRLNNKCEPAVRIVMEELAEQQGVFREELLTLAEMHDALANLINQLTDVMGIMTNNASAVDMLEKKDPTNED